MSSTLEHNLAKPICSEIYTPFEGERGISSSRNEKLTISNLKSSIYHILVETMPFVMDKPKSKKEASVSEKLALSGIYISDLPFVQNKDYQY